MTIIRAAFATSYCTWIALMNTMGGGLWLKRFYFDHISKRSWMAEFMLLVSHGPMGMVCQARHW